MELSEIRERLKFYTVGELPYRDSYADRAALYREVERELKAIAREAHRFARRVAQKRKKYERS